MIDPACNSASVGDAPQAPGSEPSVEIDIQRIMQMIPHRQPFLMIDRVINIVANAHATGIKNITINEPYFQGHFPARPVMPGVLIVEAMAQTAAVLVVHTLGSEAEGKLVYFMTIDNARFRKPVVPGVLLRLEVEFVQKRSRVCKFAGRAMLDGEIATECEFTAMIADPPA